MSKIQAYGTWKVTTEGDCEGRSTRDLGVHTGYLDDIAFALSKLAYYGLRFDWVEPKALQNQLPTGDRVQVSLGIESQTWDMEPEERVAYFRTLLNGRDVTVGKGTFYACVELSTGRVRREEAQRKKLVTSAVLKLSEDELQALMMELKERQ